MADKPRLQNLVKFHMMEGLVDGPSFRWAESNGKKLKTMQGGELVVDADGKTAFVNDAKIGEGAARAGLRPAATYVACVSPHRKRRAPCGIRPPHAAACRRDVRREDRPGHLPHHRLGQRAQVGACPSRAQPCPRGATSAWLAVMLHPTKCSKMERAGPPLGSLRSAIPTSFCPCICDLTDTLDSVLCVRESSAYSRAFDDPPRAPIRARPNGSGERTRPTAAVSRLVRAAARGEDSHSKLLPRARPSARGFPLPHASLASHASHASLFPRLPHLPRLPRLPRRPRRPRHLPRHIHPLFHSYLEIMFSIGRRVTEPWLRHKTE